MEASSSSSGPRPTAWIVIAVICALAAIGLGIWAFTTKSDLDDANATIAKQKKELASSQQAATAEEQQLSSFGRRERAAYRRVRRRLIREDVEAAGLQKRIKEEAARLQQAQTDVANAQGQSEKEDALLKQAQSKARLATACSASSVDALNRFFDASTTKAGAKAAVAQLESTQQECQNASGGS
jgi:hypothetical protein